MPNGDLSRLVERELEKMGDISKMEAGLMAEQKHLLSPRNNSPQERFERVDGKGPLRNRYVRCCCWFCTSSVLRWLVVLMVLSGGLYVYGKAVESGWAPDHQYLNPWNDRNTISKGVQSFVNSTKDTIGGAINQWKNVTIAKIDPSKDSATEVPIEQSLEPDGAKGKDGGNTTAQETPTTAPSESGTDKPAQETANNAAADSHQSTDSEHVHDPIVGLPSLVDSDKKENTTTGNGDTKEEEEELPSLISKDEKQGKNETKPDHTVKKVTKPPPKTTPVKKPAPKAATKKPSAKASSKTSVVKAAGEKPAKKSPHKKQEKVTVAASAVNGEVGVGNPETEPESEVLLESVVLEEPASSVKAAANKSTTKKVVKSKKVAHKGEKGKAVDKTAKEEALGKVSEEHSNKNATKGGGAVDIAKSNTTATAGGLGKETAKKTVSESAETDEALG